MNRLISVIIVFVFCSFLSCMDEDISKLSDSINIEPQVAVPFIHSVTTLGDLLPDDEHIYTDEEGYIQIAYSEDSIAQILSDSLLKIENQEPTEEIFLLGAIELSDFDVYMDITLSEIVSNLQSQSVSSDIINAISVASELGSAYFPPITSQTAGEYLEESSDEFENVLISQGGLSIELINNLPIEISTLKLNLRNQIDQSLIGIFSFADIDVGALASSSIEMSNTLVYNQVLVEIAELSSGGSGPNPDDQSAWVSISESDFIDIQITGSTLEATEGMVKFPQQDGPSDTFFVDMEFEEEEAEITLIDISSGYFTYTFESSVNTMIELNLEIPQLVDELGASFSENIYIVNTEFTNAQSFSRSLENYSFDFSNSINQLELNYSTQILGTEFFASYNQNDEIQISVSMEDIDFSYVEGYFGQVEEEIDEDVLDIDLGVLEDIASGIYLETPILKFIIDNSVNVPFDIDLEMVGVNEDEIVELNVPIMEVASNTVTQVDINNSNSNLSDFIAINPTEISYSGVVLSNPVGNIGLLNSISSGTNITIGYEMDLPLYVRIEDVFTTDTLALEFADDNEENTNEFIESAILKMHTENEFPIDVDLTIFFTDSLTGFVFDSLDVELLEAAEVDENGRTISASIYDSSIELDVNQIDAIYESNRALLEIKMNSFDHQNTAVKLYTDYQFIIDAGLILELNIEE